MRYEDPILATSAGTAVFAATTAVLSTALSGVFEFSLLVAIPVGLGFGMATMTAVYVGLADRVGTRHYTVALAAGAFGVTFLGTLAVGVTTGSPMPWALPVAAGAGVLAAVAVVVGSAY